MAHQRTIYVSDELYTNKALAQEMFDRLTEETGIAYRNKKDAEAQQIGPTIRKLRVRVTFERIPATRRTKPCK